MNSMALRTRAMSPLPLIRRSGCQDGAGIFEPRVTVSHRDISFTATSLFRRWSEGVFVGSRMGGWTSSERDRYQWPARESLCRLAHDAVVRTGDTDGTARSRDSNLAADR